MVNVKWSYAWRLEHMMTVSEMANDIDITDLWSVLSRCSLCASKCNYTVVTSWSYPSCGKAILRHVIYLGIIKDIPDFITCDDVSDEVIIITCCTDESNTDMHVVILFLVSAWTFMVQHVGQFKYSYYISFSFNVALEVLMLLGQ